MSVNKTTVSINQFEKAINKDNEVDVVLNNTDDVTFTIKRFLGIQDAISFVANVVESCINGENAEYLPESYDFAIRLNVIKFYTNLRLPSSMDKQYTLMYNTTAFDQVLREINIDQYASLTDAIDKKIKFTIDTMSSMYASKINEVIELFNDLLESSNEVSKNLDQGMVVDLMNKLNAKKATEDVNNNTVVVQR